MLLLKRLNTCSSFWDRTLAYVKQMFIQNLISPKQSDRAILLSIKITSTPLSQITLLRYFWITTCNLGFPCLCLTLHRTTGNLTYTLFTLSTETRTSCQSSSDPRAWSLADSSTLMGSPHPVHKDVSVPELLLSACIIYQGGPSMEDGIYQVSCVQCQGLGEPVRNKRLGVPQAMC